MCQTDVTSRKGDRMIEVIHKDNYMRIPVVAPNLRWSLRRWLEQSQGQAPAPTCTVCMHDSPIGSSCYMCLNGWMCATCLAKYARGKPVTRAFGGDYVECLFCMQQGLSLSLV
jgi:hypothetical protein